MLNKSPVLGDSCEDESIKSYMPVKVSCSYLKLCEITECF